MKNMRMNSNLTLWLTILVIALALPRIAHAQWNETCALGSVTAVPANLNCSPLYPGNQWQDGPLTGGGTKTSGPFTATASAVVNPDQDFQVSVVFDPTTTGSYSAGFDFTYNSNLTLYVFISATYLATSTFDPTYKVVSVLYSPPGNESSQAYGTDTTNGTTTTIGSSFTFSEEMTFSSGIKDVLGGSASVGWSTTSSNSSAYTNTWTDATVIATDDNSNLTYNPTKSDSINHNLDSFVIWLNPQVTIWSEGTTPENYTTGSQTTAGVSAIVADILPPVPAITMEATPPGVTGVTSVPLEYLIPQAIASDVDGVDAYMPGLGAICKNNSLYSQQLAADLAGHASDAICTQANQCGCAPSDFVEILQADPLLNYNGTTYTASPDPGTESPLEADALATSSGPGSGASVCAENPVPTKANCRYEIVPIDKGSTTPLFEPLSGSAGVTYTISDATNTTETIGGSTSWNVGISFGGGVLVASLVTKDTWTWTDSESTGTSAGSGNTMQVLLKTSTAACDENVNIYEDTMYHTFAFQVPTLTACP
jgi:hypothetical protein